MVIERSRILVVGAGLAATSAIEKLRQSEVSATVTLVGAERHEPYDRPPLSKEIIRGELNESALRADWAELKVDLQTGRRAVELRPDDHVLVLDCGESLSYDALLVATGARPKRLAGLVGQGVHVLRTIDDALALRADIKRSRHVTIVGGGFIGCEVAASARAIGAEVTLIEALAAPLAGVVGPEVAAEVAALHADAGVDLRCGTTVADVRESTRGRELLLSNGDAARGEVVLVAVGVAPETGWLDGSGIATDDGVLCDASGRTSVDGVWAAGDVARWLSPSLGAHRRFEHWTSAADQGRAVAADVAGVATPVDDVPYFWSDQYATKFQMLGHPDPGDRVTLVKVGPAADRLLAVYSSDGRVTGVFGASAAKWVMRMRSLVAERAELEHALALASA